MDPIQTDPPVPPPVQAKPAAFWIDQIKRAQAAMDTHVPWWEANLKAYAPSATDNPESYGTNVNTNRDFTLVERKKADLFYQSPEVTLQPSPLLDAPITNPQGQQLMGPPDPQTGQSQPISATVPLFTHQTLVNEHLGPDHIDAAAMMDAVLFDILCPSGVGATKMGYESVTIPTPTTDPATGLERMVPVPMHEKCFWHHISPKKFLKPANFRSCDWDTAPWLGYRFELPLTQGNRAKYQLPPEFSGSKSDGTQYFDHGAGSSEDPSQVFTGVELWYRSCLFREDRPHPDHLTHLVLVDGVDQAVIEEDSPDQTLTETGQMSPDSVIGFPIHPFHTRVLTDSSQPPSDCTLMRPLVNELNVFRTQMVQARDAMVLRWQYNTDTMPPDALQKIVRSPIGGMIGVPGEAFVGDGAIKELPQGSFPRESFTSNDYIDNDIARTTAMDASQQGVQSASSQTATAEQLQQANANARLDKERAVILKRYIQGVTKYSTYLQRYLPVQQAAKMVGPQQAQIWDVWRRQVPSNLAFTAMPDSALRVDQAVDRKQSQELYSFLANDPYVNRGELLRRLLRKFHLNPDQIVVEPPPQKPEPPKLALSFKGEDLVGPQAPIVIEILQQQGISISPQAVTQAQGMLLQAQQLAAAEEAKASADTTHGGKVAQQESLSKHAADQTGNVQNTSSPAAMGQGGGYLQ